VTGLSIRRSLGARWRVLRFDHRGAPDRGLGVESIPVPGALLPSYELLSISHSEDQDAAFAMLRIGQL
jgi:hypothetical protein